MLPALATSWPWWTAGAGLAGAAIGALTYGGFCPQCAWFAPVIWRGPTDGPPRVALTFDDGPHPEATPAIAETLGRLGVTGTFFVIGAHARQHPAVLRQLDAGGHLIGNHTDTHGWMGMFRATAHWRTELSRTNDAIAAAIGKRPRFFRPPMGFKQYFVARAAKCEALEIVNWTRRGRDGWPTDAASILRRLVDPAQAGDILTLHDGSDPHLNRDFSPTVEAIEPLVDGLRRRGLTIVRLDELIGRPGYHAEAAAIC